MLFTTSLLIGEICHCNSYKHLRFYFIFYLTRKVLIKTFLKSSAQNIPPFHLSDIIPVKKKYISKFLIRAQAFTARLEHEAV